MLHAVMNAHLYNTHTSRNAWVQKHFADYNTVDAKSMSPVDRKLLVHGHFLQNYRSAIIALCIHCTTDIVL